jgi:hypothetical protein
MLRVTGGFVPLHQIKFIDDLGVVTTIDGTTYQAEPEAIAAIMPKAAKRSKLPQWFRGLKYVRAPLSLVVMGWRLLRMSLAA